MVTWRRLSPLLVAVPGALSIVLGVLGCNERVLSRLGYERFIEPPALTADAELRP